MKTITRLLTFAAVIPVAATLNAAKVNVTSEPADKLTDVRLSHSNEDDSLAIVLDELGKSLTRDAKRFLAEDQTLDIHFTDIDLAGDFEPWRSAAQNDVRWIREIYIPRLKFDYKLTGADGKVVAEGSENLSNPAFQMTINKLNDLSNTRYESEMMSDWMRHFRAKKKSKS